MNKKDVGILILFFMVLAIQYSIDFGDTDILHFMLAGMVSIMLYCMACIKLLKKFKLLQ